MRGTITLTQLCWHHVSPTRILLKWKPQKPGHLRLPHSPGKGGHVIWWMFSPTCPSRDREGHRHLNSTKPQICFKKKVYWNLSYSTFCYLSMLRWWLQCIIPVFCVKVSFPIDLDYPILHSFWVSWIPYLEFITKLYLWSDMEYLDLHIRFPKKKTSRHQVQH